MKAGVVGLCLCVMAAGLYTFHSSATASEASDAAAEIESTGEQVRAAETAAAEAVASTPVASAPAASQATSTPAAAPAPELSRWQRIFGTFSRYRGYSEGDAYTYQLVEKDGEKMYCQQEVITGTRVGKKGVCLTLAEMEAREEAKRRNTEQFLRQGEHTRTNPPPPDGNGGRQNNAVGGTNMPTP